MRRIDMVRALFMAATMLATGCEALPGFQAAQTRVVRREGMSDDRAINATAAANAWQTIVRRRVTGPLSVDVLVVAGGGGGGGSTAGGGGGGGVVYQTSLTLPQGASIPVTVGAGGLGSPKSEDSVVVNTSGGNSVFGAITAIGGGYGGSGKPIGSRHAAVGGSGGGGGYYYGDDLIPIQHAAGTPGQGFAGGAVVGTSSAYWGGGGGGGAGGPGGNFNRDIPTGGGNGGPGMLCAISGTPAYYGGGGGGGIYLSGFTLGGIGGGGNGADGQTYSTQPGVPNTGGGGGGGGWYQYGAGGSNGGSGIVIVRYNGTSATTGGTKTDVGGYTIHTFTTVGTSTFTTP